MANQPLLISMTKAAVTVNNHSSSIYPKPKNKLQLNFLSFAFVKRKRLKPGFNHPNKVRGPSLAPHFRSHFGALTKNLGVFALDFKLIFGSLLKAP